MGKADGQDGSEGWKPTLLDMEGLGPVRAASEVQMPPWCHSQSKRCSSVDGVDSVLMALSLPMSALSAPLKAALAGHFGAWLHVMAERCRRCTRTDRGSNEHIARDFLLHLDFLKQRRELSKAMPAVTAYGGQGAGSC